MSETRGAKAQANFAARLRARSSLMMIFSREENRVESSLIDPIASIPYDIRKWDCAAGVVDVAGNKVDGDDTIYKPVIEDGKKLWKSDGGVEWERDRMAVLDPMGALDMIERIEKRQVWILRDFHKFFQDTTVQRALRNLAKSLQKCPKAIARSIVVLSPAAEIPPELSGHMTLIEWPLPDRTEVGQILDDVLGVVSDEIRASVSQPSVREAAIDAALGLTAEEISSCYAMSCVVQKRIDPATIALEKKNVIAKARGLTWHDPLPGGLDQIGGLEEVKDWAAITKLAFSERARARRIPPPRGVVLAGASGCGKSMFPKAVATSWGVPLLVADVGGSRSKWLGESESNLRSIFSLAETIAPCVLVFDEVEKAFAGAMGPSGDGGVSKDSFGAFLNWMQEKTASVFVVATCNDPLALSPEFFRKERFDEMFWVDFPHLTERESILRAALKYKGPERWDHIDIALVARAAEGFSGAEMANLVPAAILAAFADGDRDIVTADLIAQVGKTAPLSKTMGSKMDQLRQWARENKVRPASRAMSQTTRIVVEDRRELDL